MSFTEQEFKRNHENLLNTKHEDTINNIKRLQDLEKYMFQNLQKIKSGDSDSVYRQKQIVNRINELSEMRNNLFNQLKNNYSSTQEDLTEEREDLANQISVVGVVENELNKAKQNLTTLTNDKNNKLRLVQIGNYEALRYQAHTDVMKIIAYTSFVLIALSFILQRGLIPSNIASLLIMLTIAIGIILVVRKVFDISSRSNINFDQYDYGKASIDTTGNEQANLENEMNLYRQMNMRENQCGGNSYDEAKSGLSSMLDGLSKTVNDSIEGYANIENSDDIGALTANVFTNNKVVGTCVNSGSSENVTPMESGLIENASLY